MVRMHLQRKLSDNDDSTTMRSSSAWDRSRQPRRGILKRKSPPKDRSRRIPNLDTHLTVPSDDIQDLLNEMTINDKETITSSKAITVKASKLYGSPYQNCHHYDVSTAFTIRYNISDSRIQKIRRHESLVDFTDIYDLPGLFREVTDQSLESFYEQTNSDFYCNAYWAIMLTDAIAELVFEKFAISLDSEITYDPTPSVWIWSSPNNIMMMTHVLKDQLSVCEWLATTIGPNYQNDNIPYQLGPHLQDELKKVLSIITMCDDRWIEGAAELLC